jgi:hypothetical protein
VQPDRRRNIRVRIPDEELLACRAAQPSLSGQISIVSPTGLYIRTRDRLTPGDRLALRVEDRDGEFEADCVVRDVGPGGVGVEFTTGRGRHTEGVRRILARYTA